MAGARASARLSGRARCRLTAVALASAAAGGGWFAPDERPAAPALDYHRAAVAGWRHSAVT